MTGEPAQRRIQPVRVDRDDVVPAAQRREVGGDRAGELGRQAGRDDEVGRGQRDPAERGQRVMRDAAMAFARIGVR